MYKKHFWKYILGSVTVLGVAVIMVVNNNESNVSPTKTNDSENQMISNDVTSSESNLDTSSNFLFSSSLTSNDLILDFYNNYQSDDDIDYNLNDNILGHNNLVLNTSIEKFTEQNISKELKPVVSEVREELSEAVISDVVSEKGVPEIREELPEYSVVTEKGEPLVQPELPELNVSTKTRMDTTVLKHSTVYMEDIKLNKGEKRASFDGQDGSLTTTYEDLIDQDGKILESKKIDEKRVEPIVKVVRYGVKKPGEVIGESGLYHLSEHASEADIVKFNFNINLTADEIAKLGQDEIEKRSNENIENNLWLAGKPGWYVIANAPVSDEVIDKLNSNEYIDHKRIGLESLRLVNEERKRLGKKELVWSDDLYVLAKKRAINLGLNGSIRYWDSNGNMMKHVLDNKGTSWTVIAKGTGYEYRSKGENLAGHTLSRNVYQLFNEKLIAKTLYEQWKNSPGHYTNMIDDGYTEFAFDLAYSKFWRNGGTNVDYLAQGIQGVQMFAV